MNAGELESWLRPLIRRHQGNGILVDTNLLLLLLIGLANPNQVNNFKPLQNQKFSKRELDLLIWVISKFKKVITTPHILTEVSNHSKKLKGRDKAVLCSATRLFLEKSEEHFHKSSILCHQDHFVRFGLADCAISQLALDDFLVITIDFELAGHLKKQNADVINFNHLRAIGWNEFSIAN